MTRPYIWPSGTDPITIPLSILGVLLILQAFKISLSAAIPLSFLLGLTGHYFASLLLRRGSDAFNPLTFVSAYFTLDIAFRSLFLFLSPKANRIGLIGYDDYLPTALWCAVIGFLCFVVGFRSGVAPAILKKLPSVQFKWPAAVPFLRIAIVSLIGFIVFVYLFRSGAVVVGGGGADISPPSGVAIVLQRAVHIGWIAACICLLLPRIADKTLALPLVFLSIFFLAAGVLVSGSKQALIEPVVEFLIVFHYLRRHLSAWHIAAVMIPIAFAGFGALNFYRFVIVGQQGAPKSFADVAVRVSAAVDSITSGRTGGQPSAMDQMLSRQIGVDTLALVVKYTPRPRPYLNGKRLWGAVVSAVVPRAIWRGKPIYNPGRELEQEYEGMYSSYNGHTSMHVMTDLFRNFGYVGLIAGMFAAGVAYNLFYLFCSPGRANPCGVFFYSLLLPLLANLLQGDLGSNLIQVPRALLLVIVGAAFIGVRRKGLQQPSSLPLLSVDQMAEISRFENQPAV